MRIRVTAKDIRDGESGNCFRCAVALALQRQTKDDHSEKPLNKNYGCCQPFYEFRPDSA